MDWNRKRLAAAFVLGPVLVGGACYVVSLGQDPTPPLEFPALLPSTAEEASPPFRAEVPDLGLKMITSPQESPTPQATTPQNVPAQPVPTQQSPNPVQPLTLPPPNSSVSQGAYPGWDEVPARDASGAADSIPGVELSVDPFPPSTLDATTLMRPWWCEEAGLPIGYRENAQPRDLDQLISDALTYSPFIQSVQLEPQILETKVDQAFGPFDPSAFIDSIFRDTYDPVGNTLTTGSANSLEEIGTDNRIGIKKKNFRGGTGEITQKTDFLDNNSDFFLPKQQAITKLRMGYTQPLMRGSGISYNRSTIVIAQLATDASSQGAIEKMQEHVYKLSVAYWELVSARAYYRQNLRTIALLTDLRDQLAGRADIDSLQSQLWRADSTIANLQASQAKVVAQIAVAEAQLRAAIGSPDLRELSMIEILPMTLPTDWRYDISLQQELAKVLAYHPRIQALKDNLQATRVKLNVAEQDLRPTLDLVLDSYLRGLNGDYDVGQSWADQFSRGSPSYSGGLVFQRPIRNTAAKAILRERRLELRQNLLELDQSLLNIEASVVEAATQIDAAFKGLEASIRATLAAHSELEYLTDRWKDAFRDETQRSLLLDQLLNAQLQLLQSENSWARAQSDHMIAIAKLKLVTATLLSTSTL